MNPAPEVRAINRSSGRGLVLDKEGYVAFELVEGDLSVGDVIDGDTGCHGLCVWNNLSTGAEVRVYVQQVMATLEDACRRFYAPPDPPAA